MRTEYVEEGEVDKISTQSNVGLAKQIFVIWLVALIAELLLGYVMVKYFFEGMSSGGQAACLMTVGVVLCVMVLKLYRALVSLKQHLDKL